MRFRCDTCNFELWLPILELRVSFLGLYDDARFPGRCILSLKGHEEDFTCLREPILSLFIKDVQDAGSAIMGSMGASRINYALLGNDEPHVHVHLVPRYPEMEPNPRRSPWNDPRPRTDTDPRSRQGLIDRIAGALRENERLLLQEGGFSSGPQV